MDQRLRPEQRIRKRQTFQILFDKGKFVRGRLINLWAYDGPELSRDKPGPKIGIIVSRKTSLRANQRNLWKRRIREVFRKNQMRVGTNFALMVQSKKQEKVPSTEEIQKDFLLLLKKTRSLK